MVKAMQYRARINGGDWGEWHWLPEDLSWSGVEWRNVRMEFRWADVPLYQPVFTK